MSDAAGGSDPLDALAVSLVQQSSQLTRLVFMHVDVGVPRSEAGVLSRLEPGPRRISELAAAESLAQPTMTLVIKRMDEVGWVERRPDPEDRRATLISLTPTGASKLAEVRAAYRSFLSARLRRLSSEDLGVLARSMTAMGDLIELVRSDTV